MGTCPITVDFRHKFLGYFIVATLWCSTRLNMLKKTTAQYYYTDIISSFLPFSKGDTRVILVFAADICGILMYAPVEISVAYVSKHKFATNICGKHKYD